MLPSDGYYLMVEMEPLLNDGAPMLDDGLEPLYFDYSHDGEMILMIEILLM